MKKNYYHVLGILPGAEEVVIVAAYRALVSKYHPDKFSGDPNVAHIRTAEINEAYFVLSDRVRRKEYDDKIKDAANLIDDSDSEFDDALQELEQRWSVALKIFPDLEKIRNRLKKTSSKLSFAYVVFLLETKNFNDRDKIASSLEESFLKIYFGSNQKIINYAKEIISLGFKDAVKGLNKLVDVLGSNSDPNLIISSIEDEFGLKSRRRDLDLVKASKFDRIDELRSILKNYNYVDAAFEYASLTGFDVEVELGTFFSSDRYSIYEKSDGVEIFRTTSASKMTTWIRENIL